MIEKFRLFAGKTDPENDRVQLDTIQKAAAVLGKRINITFEDAAA